MRTKEARRKQQERVREKENTIEVKEKERNERKCNREK